MDATDKDKIISLLKTDLENEYKHFMFYSYAASAVTGLHREELSEFFLSKAKEELDHIQILQKLLIGLPVEKAISSGNGRVCSPVEFEFWSSPSPENLLEFALKMELEVVERYVNRLHSCENHSQDCDFKYIELVIEDLMVDSRADADELREMLNANRE